MEAHAEGLERRHRHAEGLAGAGEDRFTLGLPSSGVIEDVERPRSGTIRQPVFAARKKTDPSPAATRESQSSLTRLR